LGITQLKEQAEFLFVFHFFLGIWVSQEEKEKKKKKTKEVEENFTLIMCHLKFSAVV
jgi:hypothetical protein